LRAAPPLFAPGSVFSYEHTESVLLAEIVRRSTGRASLELIAEQLLAPLGIEAGSFATAPDERDAGRRSATSPGSSSSSRRCPARTWGRVPASCARAAPTLASSARSAASTAATR
jgi:CubicO group peptidase (beta-lactamase class C family)